MRLGVAAGPFRSLAVARRDGAEQGPVLAGEDRPVVLSVQECDLVAQHDDLKVLRASQAQQPSAPTTPATGTECNT